MAIISTIGRRHWKVRLLLGTIYLGLTIGAITMVYPFALMIAGSTKSAVDTPNPHVVPPYLYNDSALWQKHAEAHFNESLAMAQATYYHDAVSFQKLQPPTHINHAMVDAWQKFCHEATLPFYTYMIGEIHAPMSRGVLPERLRKFKRILIKRFDADISRLNREMEAEFVNWNSFYHLPESFLTRRERAGKRPLDEAFREFKASQPISARYYFSIEGYYLTAYLRNRYGRQIEDYNQAHDTSYTDWTQVHLPRTAPQDNPAERQDWEDFVRTIVNLYWLRIDEQATPQYQQFLEAKYKSIDGLNRLYQTSHSSFGAIPLITAPQEDGLPLSDWAAWLEGWRDPELERMYQAPLDAIRIHSVDFMFRDWLEEQYGELAEANRQLGTTAVSWLEFLPAQEQLHFRAFQENKAHLRTEFTIRNFITVIDYIVLHGRGLFNTALYCTLAILGALFVNPLAAYALSRYKPPSQYKVLLFLMMTMAFPPMVTQIPVFLMLREFNLLNTFWALVLPGLANGYSIFLLKGFFDSLPQELYESAELDGAGEIRIFLQITMSLSTPILAVIALNAFTMAYSNFMMALLICQDQKMWTLMPWLYQLQSRSGEGVVFASLLIAAIPTFTVFALCQNIIMRGIVVPVEK